KGRRRFGRRGAPAIQHRSKGAAVVPRSCLDGHVDHQSTIDDDHLDHHSRVDDHEHPHSFVNLTETATPTAVSTDAPLDDAEASPATVEAVFRHLAGPVHGYLRAA